jgi:hypothetical protein
VHKNDLRGGAEGEKRVWTVADDKHSRLFQDAVKPEEGWKRVRSQVQWAKGKREVMEDITRY